MKEQKSYKQNENVGLLRKENVDQLKNKIHIPTP
jgi:hypothetical protein